jgi:hypothetical protein
MSAIRNQLKSQSLDTVIPSAFKQVGGVVFPDTSAVMNLNDLTQIVNSYRSVHAIAYGSPIPNTGTVKTGIENGEGLEPLDNEAYNVLAISATNGGGAAPLEVEITISDVKMYAGAIPPNQTIGLGDLPAIFPFTLVKGNALKFTVTSGTATDLTAKVAYNKTCQ